MNAIAIIQEYLKKHKFDGLADPDIACYGCSSEHIMQHCRYLTTGCRPAHKLTCECGDVFYTSHTYDNEDVCPACREAKERNA